MHKTIIISIGGIGGPYAATRRVAYDYGAQGLPDIPLLGSPIPLEETPYRGWYIGYLRDLGHRYDWGYLHRVRKLGTIPVGYPFPIPYTSHGRGSYQYGKGKGLFQAF